MLGATSVEIKMRAPRRPQSLARPRLFELLDSARADQPVVWVSGPAGSGKSMAVSGYLESRGVPHLWYTLDEGDGDLARFFSVFGNGARERYPALADHLPRFAPGHLAQLSSFARSFFESLYDAQPRPFAVVLDDVHEIDGHSPWDAMLRDGLARVPAGVTLIGISRSDAPAGLSRLRAGSELAFVGWDALQLSDDETRAMVELLGAGLEDALPDGFSDALHCSTAGWAAGVSLMLDWVRRTGCAPTLPLDPRPPSPIFDYFSAEVFERLDDETQQLLLEVAALPFVSESLALRLSDSGRAAECLHALFSNNCWTELDGISPRTYRFHRLFHSYLRDVQRRTLEPTDLRDLDRRCVVALAKQEHWEEAVDLAVASGCWDQLAPLVERIASALLAEGRHHTLEGWLARAPEPWIDAQGRLLHWRARACAHVQPEKASALFAKALRALRQQGDADRCFVAWAEWVTTAYFKGDPDELAELRDALAELRQRCPAPRSEEVEDRVALGEMLLLHHSDPSSREIPALIAQGTRALARVSDHATRLAGLMVVGLHHAIDGASSSVDATVEALRTLGAAGDPVALSVAALQAGMSAWMSARFEESERQLAEGVELARAANLALWLPMLLLNRARCALAAGDSARAERHLRDAADQALTGFDFNRSFYLWAAANVALHTGAPAEALRLNGEAKRVDAKTGHVQNNVLHETLAAMALLDTGDGVAALAASERAAAAPAPQLYRFAALLAHARVRLEIGPEDGARGALEQALRFGRERGFLCAPVWRPACIVELCAAACRWDIEPEYVRTLIATHRLVPEAHHRGLKSWPWPLKISTLGAFDVERYGEPLELGQKVPIRRLHLLAAIIAFGSRDVPEERLCDALWPDAEGDAAHRSLNTTLHRLRTTLGDAEVIVVRGRRVSLDRERCWVDLWALDDLLDAVEATLAAPRIDGAALQRHVDGVLELYRGPFLDSEGSVSWCLIERERLSARVVDVAVKFGRWLEQRDAWDRARAHYERALASEPTAEPLYQGLLRCHQARGERPAAEAAFARCECALGVAPCAATRQLLDWGDS